MRPVINVESAEQILDISYSNANNTVVNLEKLSILQERTGKKRNREYSYKSYLDLFKA
jgi:Fic family protein